MGIAGDAANGYPLPSLPDVLARCDSISAADTNFNVGRTVLRVVMDGNQDRGYTQFRCVVKSSTSLANCVKQQTLPTQETTTKETADLFGCVKCFLKAMAPSSIFSLSPHTSLFPKKETSVRGRRKEMKSSSVRTRYARGPSAFLYEWCHTGSSI